MRSPSAGVQCRRQGLRLPYLLKLDVMRAECLPLRLYAGWQHSLCPAADGLAARPNAGLSASSTPVEQFLTCSPPARGRLKDRRLRISADADRHCVGVADVVVSVVGLSAKSQIGGVGDIAHGSA
jgi:hypothetical protein